MYGLYRRKTLWFLVWFGAIVFLAIDSLVKDCSRRRSAVHSFVDERAILAMGVHLNGLQLHLSDERVDGESVAALATAGVAATEVNFHGLST